MKVKVDHVESSKTKASESQSLFFGIGWKVPLLPAREEGLGTTPALEFPQYEMKSCVHANNSYLRIIHFAFSQQVK